MKTYYRCYIFGFLMAIGELVAYANGRVGIGLIFAAMALGCIFTGMKLFHDEQVSGVPHENE